MKLKKLTIGIKRRTVFRLVLAGILLPTVLLVLRVTVTRIRRPEKEVVVLAVVNGVSITVSDFKERMADLPSYYRPYAVANRSQFLQDLIDREIIYRKARRSRYARDPDIEKRVREFRKELVIQEYIQHQILKKTDFSEQELKDYYQDNLFDFFQPASIHLYEILLPDRRTAERIRREVQTGGKSFEDLAREHSQAPSGSTGGDLGFVREGDLSPKLESVAFNLMPGNISPVISTDIGYYLLMAKHKIPGRQLGFEEARPSIKNVLSSKGVEERFRDFLGELKSRTRIKVMEENLEDMAL